MCHLSAAYCQMRRSLRHHCPTNRQFDALCPHKHAAGHSENPPSVRRLATPHHPSSALLTVSRPRLPAQHAELSCHASDLPQAALAVQARAHRTSPPPAEPPLLLQRLPHQHAQLPPTHACTPIRATPVPRVVSILDTCLRRLQLPFRIDIGRCPREKVNGSKTEPPLSRNHNLNLRNWSSLC